MKRLIAIAALMMTAGAAQAFERVSDLSTFNSLLAGKQLRLGIYGLTLNVTPNGQITGQAVGYGVTGSWDWQDGYFCRQMDWSGTEIPYNCQLVEVRGSQIRFITDRGAGDNAVFNLR